MTAARATAASRAPATPVGVTLITGFLGSGKTTLLNRLLTGSGGRRIAVVVNEFGQLAIDTALIASASESVVELANGCICCATQGDLLRSLDDLLAGPQPLDDVVIEASGLADPGPVLDGLVRYRFARELEPSGVVTVVDAANFDANLEHAEAAFHQIVYGDLLLINKVDLVDERTAELIEQGVRRLNADAPLVRCVQGRVPAELLLGVPRGNAAAGLHEHHHEHDFDTVALTVAAPLDRERFEAWQAALPAAVLRAKGFVRFAGDPAAHVYQRVGGRHELALAASAPPLAEDAGAMVVLIGRGLDVERLDGGLRACAGGRA